MSTSKKCFSVEEAIELLIQDDEQDGEHDIIIIPPDNNREITDKEDVHDQDLGEANIHNIPGHVELQTMTCQSHLSRYIYCLLT